MHPLLKSGVFFFKKKKKKKKNKNNWPLFRVSFGCFVQRHTVMAQLWKKDGECKFRPDYGSEATGLFVNADWAPASLWSLMSSSVSVTCEVCVCCAFVVGFAALALDLISSTLLLCVHAALFVLAYIVSVSSFESSPFAVAAIAYVLSPVLASLAAPVSNDTVAALVSLLLLLHLFSFNYFAFPSSRVPLVSANAGLLATVFLCSRFASLHDKVFAMLSHGLLLFGLAPMVAIPLPVRFALPPICGVFGFLFLSLYLPDFVSAVYWFCALVAVINFIAPFLFWRMQRFKMIMKGQWSEAHLE
jgi:hypothetical protein